MAAIHRLQRLSSDLDYSTCETNFTLGLAELSQASALVGKQVQAVTSAGQTVTGTVKSVSMVNGVPMLDVNDQSIDLYNVQKVMAAPPASTPPA